MQLREDGATSTSTTINLIYISRGFSIQIFIDVFIVPKSLIPCMHESHLKMLTRRRTTTKANKIKLVYGRSKKKKRAYDGFTMMMINCVLSALFEKTEWQWFIGKLVEIKSNQRVSLNMRIYTPTARQNSFWIVLSPSPFATVATKRYAFHLNMNIQINSTQVEWHEYTLNELSNKTNEFKHENVVSIHLIRST